MNNIFEFPTLEQAYENIETIRNVTNEKGYSIIRGAVSMADVNKYRGRVLELFAPTEDIRVSGDYQRGGKDFQRLDLGEYPSSSRFARYFFFFSWNNNDLHFSSINRAQMTLFNLLAKLPPNFGMEGDNHEDRFRVSYVIQYPIGGGFMSKHREYSITKNDKSYVVYLALTTRGVDYEKGGAYLFVNDEMIDIEEKIIASDLVIYRGDMFHGVSGVDRDKPVRLGEICGRMILTTQVNYFNPEKSKTA